MLFLFLLLPLGLLCVLLGLERYERRLDESMPAPAHESTPAVANPQRIAIAADLPVGMAIARPAAIPPLTEPV